MDYDYRQAVRDPPSFEKTVTNDAVPWGYPDDEFLGASPTRDDKIAYQTSLELLQRYLTATKWGRALRDDTRFSSLVETQASDEDVLETFLGHVDAVEDDRAHVTLRAPSGEILKGHYSATNLANYGIVDGSRFECSTIKIGPNDVRITFRPLPSLAGTPEALQAVRESLKLDLDDANFRDDY